MLTSNNKIAEEICEALGLKHVRKLDIHMAINEAFIVTVEYYPEIDGVMQIIPILKKFTLISEEEQYGNETSKAKGTDDRAEQGSQI